MRNLGKLAFAVSAAALALVSAGRGDSAVTAPGVATPPPVAPSGAWTGQGWSDAAAPAAGEANPPSGYAAPPTVDAAALRPDNARPPAAAEAARTDGAAPRWPDHDDWRRQTWDGGQGNAFRYRRGEQLPDTFAAPGYVVRDWHGLGLPAPGPTRDWIRYYDDAVLVDRYGTVVDAIPRVGWDRQMAGFAADAPGQAYPAYQDPRYGTAYDTGECRRAADGGFLPGTCTHHAADGSVTVTTTTAPVITTHTTVVNRPVRTGTRKAAPVRKRTARPAR